MRQATADCSAMLTSCHNAAARAGAPSSPPAMSASMRTAANAHSPARPPNFPHAGGDAEARVPAPLLALLLGGGCSVTPRCGTHPGSIVVGPDHGDVQGHAPAVVIEDDIKDVPRLITILRALHRGRPQALEALLVQCPWINVLLDEP